VERRVGDAVQVTVVIPLLDTARYVQAAIDSALAQDVDEGVVIDVVVVDDGSTDDGPDLVEAYGPPVRLVRHPERRGPAAARNTALARSNGPFVSFLDADDVMPPDRLRTHLRYLAERPDVGFVLGHQVLVLEEGQEVPAWLLQPLPTTDETFIDVQPLGGTARRSVFARIGAFDEALLVAEDIDWLLRCREGGVDVLVVPEVSVHRRVHASNTSHAAVRNGDTRRALLGSLHRIMERRRAASGPERP
jgi:glycosyltransferase involved in cell wall biosynthesis